MKAFRWLGVLLALGLGCQGERTDQQRADAGGATMQLTSTAFAEGATIPKQYTADGKDVSPPLRWTGVPAGTKSLALICDDPDAPRKDPWVHWVLFNVAPEKSELPEGLPPTMETAGGARQGQNDFGNTGYGGPSPPPGKPHRYFFKLYALDTMLSLKAVATKAQLEKAMQGHVLAQGQLMGTYGR
jgi:Raf kinase inhibitor-like YbhB/YbcL family protein